MTLPRGTLGGATFFQSIRPEMDRNRGMTVGNDGGLQYVVLDAALYRLEIFLRDDPRTFTATALTQSPDIRVISNASHTAEYNYLSAAKAKWQGEVIIRGSIPRPGECDSGTSPPACYPSHYFFGRENGIPIWRYHSTRGDPSAFSPRLEYGVGRLLPLVQAHTPYGPLPGTWPSGVHMIPGCIGSNAMTQWFHRAANTGKVGIGLHRASGCIIVFCQEQGASPGMHVSDLVRNMIAMGVDDAVMGDGSDSACLVVDQVVHAKPGGMKDRSITTGFMFRLTPLTFQPVSFWDLTGSTNPLFRPSERFQNFEGTITSTDSGLTLIVTSLGTKSGRSKVDTARELGVSALPVTLTSPSTDLTSGVAFATSGSPNVIINNLKLTRGSGRADQLTGTLRIATSSRVEGNLVTYL